MNINIKTGLYFAGYIEMTAAQRYLPSLSLKLALNPKRVVLLSRNEETGSIIEHALKSQYQLFCADAKKALNLHDVASEIITEQGAVLAIVVHETGDDVLQCVATLRQRYPWLGVLVLCAGDDINARLDAYVAGADLCLALPLANEELCIVTATLIRRLRIPETGLLQEVSCHALCLNLERGELCYQGKTLPLHRPELDFLHALILAPDNFLSNEHILKVLGHDDDDFYGKKRVHVMLSRLRGRVEKQWANLSLVSATRGKGYSLAQPLSILSGMVPAVCEELISAA